MMRAVLVAGVAGLLLVGCVESGDRRDARETLTEQLVDAGLSEDLADCVVDRFFAVRTDAQLKAFYERESLTSEERDEFADLAQVCSKD